MIHIGNQTSFVASPLDPFAFAVAHGFAAFEWFPDKKPDGLGWDDSDLSAAQRQELRATARSRQIRLSVHARWQANPLEPESAARIERDLDLARDLGASLLVLHLYHEAGLPAYIEAITPWLRQTARVGLQLAIENTPDHPPELFNELFAGLRALRDAPTQHAGMCLDVGHANLCAATRNDYLQFMDRLAPEIPLIHLHLHENWGDTDDHLTLFTGPARLNDAGIRGLVERLRRRDFSGSIIFEQWPQPPQLLEQARDRLMRLWAEDQGQPSQPQPRVRGDSGFGPLTGGLARELVEGNRVCRSWREKLDFLCGLLARETKGLTQEELVDLVVYLRFLSTGEIACVEDGRHFRPAHHARLSRQIQERLRHLTTVENAGLIRRLYPYLPSSAPEFQRAEPLTRIRDIAHRNDIPAELKREIKQTLQNKLHRCAGPEDLVTAAALLERLVAPGARYAPDFVAQFRVFHEELQEFFNARSLDERLKSLRNQVDDSTARVLDDFLGEKGGLGPESRLRALRQLTELRRRLLDTLEGQPDPDGQALRLAEMGLEDFAFVLLSELINRFEVAAKLAPASAPPVPASALPALHQFWREPLETLRLTVENIQLSGIALGEGPAIVAELRAWSQDFDPAQRWHLLRLKATVDRCRRLAEDYGDRILAWFPPRAERLGRALGVADHAIRVFGEAEIRRNLIFQLSKLCAALRQRLRESLALPAWDVIVCGSVTGRLRAVERLDELETELPEPAIALLRETDGDEEIPRGVCGVVLARELPHLSHLGVRARQAGVVLATIEEPAKFEELLRLSGQRLELVATPDTLVCRPVTLGQRNHAATPRQSPALPAANLESGRWTIPIDQAENATCGGKATGLARLRQLAHNSGGGFTTPPALVIPFGVLAMAWRRSPHLASEYQKGLHSIADASGRIDPQTVERLRCLILELDVPDEIVRSVAETFTASTPLMVRSSANGEDLDEWAGAGLYESLGNVAVAELKDAVRKVWSSLWTPRAAMSRQQAGIPHDSVHMAVIVQPMIPMEGAFILHTVNPVSQDSQKACVELVVGLGETLASAASRGHPYRLLVNKSTDQVDLLAFANFSEALQPVAAAGLTRQVVNYARIPWSTHPERLVDLGRQLAAMIRLAEPFFGCPQDMEGGVAGGRLFLVQSRRQQGLHQEDL